MGMNIKKIELILENCEVVSVDTKYIGRFHIGDIKHELGNVGCNGLSKTQTCGIFYMELHKDFDEEGVVMSFMPEASDVFSRIVGCNDIAQIEVHYEDGSSELYYTDYWGDEVNANQDSIISAAGHLYIKISSRIKTLNEIFSDEILASPDYEWPWTRL